MPLHKISGPVLVYKSVNYFFYKVAHDLSGRGYTTIDKLIDLKH